MPEGPELERMRLGLAPLIGRRVTFNLIAERKKYPTARELRPLRRVRLRDIKRHGKRLAFVTDTALVTFGAGMSGQWRWGGAAIKHDVISINTRNSVVYLNDVRRFGFMTVHAPDYAWHDELGPDGLDRESMFGRAARATLEYRCGWYRNREIKPALLDQKMIASLGNIYASEVCWRLKVHPQTCLRDFEQWRELGPTIYRVLASAVKGGGTTLRYANPWQTPERGVTNGLQLEVYDREGMICRRCHSLIVKIQQAGRATYFCPSPRCQILAS